MYNYLERIQISKYLVATEVFLCVKCMDRLLNILRSCNIKVNQGQYQGQSRSLKDNLKKH